MIRYGTIYKITNIENNKIYIGSTTKKSNERFQEHIRAALKGKTNSLIHKAMKKYGIKNFVLEEICSAIEEESNLYYLEDYFIDHFSSLYKFNNYNLVYSNRGIGSREYISEAMKNEWKINREKRLISFKNKKLDPEIEKRRLEKLRIIWDSEEYKQKLSKSTKNNWEKGLLDNKQTMINEWANPEQRMKRIKSFKLASKHRMKPLIRIHIYDGSHEIYESTNDARRAGYSFLGIYESLRYPGTKGQNNLWFYYDESNPISYYVSESLKLLGRFKTEFSTPIIQINIKTNEIRELENVLKVNEQGFEVKRVMRCLKGKRKSTYGYLWKYK